jgi:hypothetical protein
LNAFSRKFRCLILTGLALLCPAGRIPSIKPLK